MSGKINRVVKSTLAAETAAMSFGFGRIFPEHALHGKGLQRHKGVGPLVSSQEHRALLVSVINRLSTADEPIVNR